jgi:2-polyprenyl-6-methoxyphenol hydroxylase-like FAD-dependent oxidoreductase
MIDFFGPGFDAAETMGLLPRHRELAYTVNELNYVDRSGRPWAALDYQRMVNSLDGRLISLLRGDLALALYEGLSQRVVQSYGCSVKALDERANEVTAALTDETRWSGDLVIGADGIHSAIRELSFGPELNYLRYADNAPLAVAGAQLLASNSRTERTCPMRSPATTHAWQRPWRTNRLRDGEPPNGSFPLPHAGSCSPARPLGHAPARS